MKIIILIFITFNLFACSHKGYKIKNVSSKSSSSFESIRHSKAISFNGHKLGEVGWSSISPTGQFLSAEINGAIRFYKGSIELKSFPIVKEDSLPKVIDWGNETSIILTLYSGKKISFELK